MSDKLNIFLKSVCLIFIYIQTVETNNDLKYYDKNKSFMKKQNFTYTLINNSTTQVNINILKSSDKNAVNDKYSFQKLLEPLTTILLSGMFDKSFFITAFMAIKYSKCMVFTSASLALSLVGVLSVFLGLAVTTYIPAVWIDTFSIFLFLFFGIKLIFEAYSSPINIKKSEKSLEIEEKIAFTENININNNCLDQSTEILENYNTPKLQAYSHGMENLKKTTDNMEDEGDNLKIFVNIFMLIFTSEIGDRSQISTIYLTNNYDKMIVLASSVISQMMLTVLAISIGVIISNKVSERNLSMLAGMTFILFGFFALYFFYEEHSDFLCHIYGLFKNYHIKL